MLNKSVLSFLDLEQIIYAIVSFCAGSCSPLSAVTELQVIQSVSPLNC